LSLHNEKGIHKFKDKPVVIPQDQLDKLNKILELHRNKHRSLKSEETIKSQFLQRLCCKCNNLAKYIASCDLNNAVMIRRYYPKCLEEDQKGNIEHDY
jgi:hypothetical protein